jgi:hypothetical protein
MTRLSLTSISTRGRARRIAAPAGVALAATLLLAAAAFASAGHAISGGHYAGKTTQSQGATIVVSANGRTITQLHAAIANDGECGKAGGTAYSISAANIAITNGSFTVTAPGTASKLASLKVVVTGTFIGKTVAGTVAELAGHCKAPRQVENPYLATFTLTDS